MQGSRLAVKALRSRHSGAGAGKKAMKPPTNSHRATFATAVGELRAGRIERAAELCSAILASAAGDPAVHQLSATIALRQGRIADAERWAQSSLELRPDFPPALIVAGRVARAAGKLAQATSWLRRATELAPERSEPAFLLCVMRVEQRDPEVNEMLEQLLRRFPNDANGWGEIGSSLRLAGRLEAAAAAFGRAAKASGDPTHRHNLGTVLAALGRRDAAIAVFRDLIAAAPHLVDARLALAMCLRQSGETEAARAELEIAAAAAPSDSRPWFALGLVREDLADLPGAILAYRKSVELQPDFPEAHVNLGLVLQQSGELDVAMKSYERAVRLRADAFGRVAQALTSAKTGQLWLDLGRLRRSLGA